MSRRIAPASHAATVRPLRVAAPPAADRSRQRVFFETHLRAVTNRQGRPYADRTIGAYLDAVISLDRYLNEIRFEGDFSAVDAATLNGYFRWYRDRNTQGGTNTKQRNLRPLFEWLAVEYEVPNPYDDPRLNRYAAATEKPGALDNDVIAGMLRAANGNSYEDRRDTAIIRLFLSGMRREEMTRLRVEDLDVRNRVVVVRARLKGGPERVVPFGHKTAYALGRWLRVRPSNPYAESDSAGRLWLASRNRAALTGNGIYRMLRRRAAEAGFSPDVVRPHLFRHTRAHEHLADGGQEGDLMRTMGWRTRAMVDRYAAGLAEKRAIDDAHRRNLDDRH